jgi:hypothetical protein
MHLRNSCLRGEGAHPKQGSFRTPTAAVLMEDYPELGDFAIDLAMQVDAALGVGLAGHNADLDSSMHQAGHQSSAG